MIFAIDFDGTIVDHEFPNIGKLKPDAIRVLKLMQKRGHKIILWTCRCGTHLSDAMLVLKGYGIDFDGINCNILDTSGYAVPKIYADVYFDDRSFPPFTDWLDVEKTFCV